jgi:ribosome maturation factor RimP
VRWTKAVRFFLLKWQVIDLAKPNTVQRVEEIIKPFADELGLDIWDVTFKKEGSQWYLRVFIDKEGGINIDDCVDLTHAVSEPLDKADPIPQNYMLEISSPGVERELTKDAHFQKYIGAPVMLRTIRPVDGVRDFKGELLSFEDKQISVRLQDDKVMTFDKKDTNFVKLDDFDINDFV